MLELANNVLFGTRKRIAFTSEPAVHGHLRSANICETYLLASVAIAAKRKTFCSHQKYLMFIKLYNAVICFQSIYNFCFWLQNSSNFSSLSSKCSTNVALRRIFNAVQAGGAQEKQYKLLSFIQQRVWRN